MKQKEIADNNEPASLTEILDELWNRPKDTRTTSEKIDAIDPVTAEKYRAYKAEQKETRSAILDVRAWMKEQRERQAKNDPLKLLRNVAKFIIGEIDKR